MLSAIVYQSLTGSCKKYAELLSAALHIPAFPMGKEHIREDGTIIFVGWAFSGKIMGYKKAAEKYLEIGLETLEADDVELTILCSAEYLSLIHI